MAFTMAEAVVFLNAFGAEDTVGYGYTRDLPLLADAVQKLAVGWVNEDSVAPASADKLLIYDDSASEYKTVLVGDLPSGGGGGGDMLGANNLSDVDDPAVSRANILGGDEHGNKVLVGDLTFSATPHVTSVQVDPGGGLNAGDNNNRLLLANATEGAILVSDKHGRIYVNSANGAGPFEFAVLKNANSIASGAYLFKVDTANKAEFGGAGHLKLHGVTSAEEADGSFAAGARSIWYNTDTNKPRYHDGTAAADLVGGAGGGITSVVDADDWEVAGIGADTIAHWNAAGTHVTTSGDFKYTGSELHFIGYKFFVTGGSPKIVTNTGDPCNLRAKSFVPDNGGGLYFGPALQIILNASSPNKYHNDSHGHEFIGPVFLDLPTSAPTVPAGRVAIYSNSGVLTLRTGAGTELALGTPS